MSEAGLFQEDDRIELIDGEIIEMSPIGTSHAACVKRLNYLLASVLGQRAIVSIQDPVKTGDHSEPPPDVALLRFREDFYAEAHPEAKDIFLAVEVADSSTGYDREIKIPLYARSRIAQAVLVDLPAETIEVYSRPVKGRYRNVLMLKRGDTMRLQNLPGIELAVDQILG